jgi:PKD repeat protein
MTRRRTRFDAMEEPRNRRPGPISGRRLALAVAVAALALALSPRGASADSGASLGVTANVFAANGTQSTSSVTAGGLQAQSAQCTVYTGGSYINGETFPTWTWTVWTALGCLSPALDLNNVSAVVVQKPDGSAESQLSPLELQGGQGSPDASTPPVVFDDGSNMQYYDGTPGDHVETQQFTVDVYEGPALDVRIVPSHTSVPQGGSVTFTADPATGSPTKYSWSFDGAAADSSQAAPTVQFQEAGNYTVTVEVSDEATGSGGSATTQVTVTSPVTPPTATGTNPNLSQGTNGSPSAPAHGAARGRTEGNGSRPSARHGGSSPGRHTRRPDSKHRSATPASGSGGRKGSAGGSGSGSGNGSGGRSAAGGGSRAGSASTTVQGTHPASTASPSHGQISAPAHSAARPPRVATVRPTRPAPRTAPLERGRLISDVTLLAPGAIRVAQAAEAAGDVAVMRRGVRASLVPLLGGLLVAALLLGLGAAVELRGQRGARTLRLRI